MSSTLDRLVLQHGAGWRRYARANGGNVPAVFWLPPGSEAKHETMGIVGPFVAVATNDPGMWPSDHYLPSPSTDMNAAMDVVGKFDKRRWRLSLDSQADNSFRAIFANENNWWSGSHPNPATAICLAALAAVGVEYKENDNG
jgi:hypothetical protein